MGGASLFRFLVLLAVLVAVRTAKNDIRLVDAVTARRLGDILPALFPVNIIQNFSSTRSSVPNRIVGPACSGQVALMQQGLTNGSLWAIKMVDASSKIPSGVFMGNWVDLGMFDECTEVRVTEGGQEIRGRHCMYILVIRIGGTSIVETLSICMPASCQAEDVEEMVKNAVEMIRELVSGSLQLPIDVISGSTTCTAVDPPKWTAGRIVTLLTQNGHRQPATFRLCVTSVKEFRHRNVVPTFLVKLRRNWGHHLTQRKYVVTPASAQLHEQHKEYPSIVGFSVLLLFLVGCTVWDIIAKCAGKRTVPNSPVEMLRQFSLYTNAARVLNAKTSPGTLPAIQGLRFFSMCWVIMGHSYLTIFNQSVLNFVDFYTWIPTWNSLYIVTATFAVDSFFAISGFLMSYLFLKEMLKAPRFNLFSYYLHRYLRLTPALVALILLAIFVTPHIGSGPLWEKKSNLEVEKCRDNWWTKLLYLHNYVNMDSSDCLGHTWYLATEMQFFWISPLILYPLAKTPRLGLVVLAALFVASVATPVIIGFEQKYSVSLISKNLGANGEDYMADFYVPSHVRAAPWLIGIFFGYLAFEQRESSAIRVVTKWIGWLLTAAAFSFCIFTMRIFQDVDYTYDDVWEAFYTALARPLWGFAVSWVIYASVRGFGGAVSKLLSFPIFTPLARISYSIYLVHFHIQSIKSRAARTAYYFSDFFAFDRFLSDLLLSIIVGFVFTILFESPVLVLEKIVKKRWAAGKNDSHEPRRAEEVEKGRDNPGFVSN